jgi:HEAT repeat protein
MSQFWKPATPELMASRGNVDGLVRALRPKRLDFDEARDGQVFDLGWERRATAARLLGSCADGKVVDALLGALRDYSPAVRTDALGSLAGRPDPIDAELIAAVLSWSEAHARAGAEVVLGERAERYPAAAARMVHSYLDGVGRTASELSDGWIRRVLHAAPEGERSALTERATRSAIADPSGGRRAVQVLAANASEGIPMLLARAGHERDRVRSIRVLGALHDPSAMAPLVEMLEHRDADARAAAAGALGEIRDPHAIEPLLRTTTDAEYAVRDAALRALDSFGTAAIVWGLAAAGQGALRDLVAAAESWTTVGARRATKALEPGSTDGTARTFEPSQGGAAEPPRVDEAGEGRGWEVSQ